ncbi:MAG: cytochrome D1 domain-containing protein [Chloroflexota bacterium]
MFQQRHIIQAILNISLIIVLNLNLLYPATPVLSGQSPATEPVISEPASTTALTKNIVQATTQSSAQLSIQTSTQTLDIGDTFEATVQISGVEPPLSAFQFDLVYDATRLSLVNHIAGDFLSTGLNTVNNPAICPQAASPSAGVLRFACARNGVGQGVMGDGLLLTVRFAANAGGTAQLDLTNIQLADGAVPPNGLSASTQSSSVVIDGSSDLARDPYSIYLPVVKVENNAAGNATVNRTVDSADEPTPSSQPTTSSQRANVNQLAHATVRTIPRAVATKARKAETCFAADLDCDTDVDSADVAQAAAHWNCALGEACYAAHVDLDTNNVIDAFDLAWVANEYDVTAPVVTMTEPADGAVVAGQDVLVRGEVVDTHEIAPVTVNGVAATLAAATLDGTEFSVRVPVEMGNQVLDVVAYDSVGQVGLASRVIGVDGAGPQIVVAEPRHRQSVYTASPTISLTFADAFDAVNPSTVKITLRPANGGEIDITGDLAVNAEGASGQVGSVLATDVSYTLHVSVADTNGNVTTHETTFYIPPSPDEITPPVAEADSGWVSGQVYDAQACDAHLQSCQPLAGATVTLEQIVDPDALAQLRTQRRNAAIRSMARSAQLPPLTRAATRAFARAVDGSVVTGPDGFFAFPAAKTGTYWLKVERDGYTYAQREIEIVKERSTATNDVYLTPLDAAETTCDSGGCTHDASDGSLQLVIPEGAIPDGETRQVNATNFEQVEFLPSGDLPPGTWETYAFNLGGASEITFTQPITVRQQNSHGFDPGTKIPLGYWNQFTQAWEPAGTGTVDASGQWIEMTVTHFSNYDCNDPIAPLPDVDIDTGPPPDDSGNDNDQPSDNPTQPCTGELGCFINYKTGELQEWIDLPSVNILGEAVAPQLRYNTRRALPSQVIDVQLNLANMQNVILGDYIGWELYIEGEKTDSFTFDANLTADGEIGRYRYLWDGKNAQGDPLPPGIYQYRVKFSIPYQAQYCYALNGIFGNPPDCVNGGTGRYADAFKEFWVSGSVAIDNQVDSSLGASWVWADQQRLYASEEGRILVGHGERLDEFYFPGFPDIQAVSSGESVAETVLLAWTNVNGDTIQLMPESIARSNRGYTTSVGDRPLDIAFSPDGMMAYVTNRGEATVSVIDLNQQESVATINVGKEPIGIELSADGTIAYVANWDDDTLSIIDLASQLELYTINVGDGPHRIALTADETKAYIPNWFDNTVSLVDLEARQVIASIAVGDKPYEIALSSDETMAYVTNRDDNSVSVIDLVNQQEVATISVGTNAFGISLSQDESTAYVTNWGDDTVSVIDLSSRQEVTTIPVGDKPIDIVLSNDGTIAYVTNLNDNTVSIIDLASQQEITTIGSAGSEPFNIELLPNGRMVYVTNIDSDSITAIDLTTQEAISSVDVGDKPARFVFSPDRKLAYVPNRGAGTVSVVDLVTQNETMTIGVGNEPNSIALSADGTLAYLTNFADDTVLVIDLTSQQVVNTIRVGNGPGGIALSNDETTAYIRHWYDDNMSIIDLESQQITTVIPVGDKPADLLLSADETTVYVTNRDSNSLSVIDLINQTTIATIGVGNKAFIIALSSDEKIAYITNWEDDTVSVVDLNSYQEIDTFNTGDFPTGIVLSVDSQIAYVANREEDTISVIDLATRQIVSTIFTEDGPTYMKISSNRSTSPFIFSQTDTDYSTLTYDPATQQYTRIYPDGKQITFNAQHQHTHTVTPDGQTTTYTYNDDGSLDTVAITAPGAATAHWVWDLRYTAAGQLASILDPAGRTTSFTINANDELTAVQFPDGRSRHFAYDANHLLTQHTDRNGETTTYAYDGYGRIQTLTEPPQVGYDAATGQNSITQEVRTFSPSDTSAPLINESVVGSPDNPAPAVPLSAAVVDAVTYSRGSLQGHTDRWGYWMESSDALNRTTTYVRDEAGRPLRTIHPDGDCVEQTFDAVGNVLTKNYLPAAQCALPNGTRNTAQMQSWVYTYEPEFNQIKTETDPMGNTTTYVYDYEEGVGNAGKLIRILYPPVANEQGTVVTPQVSYTYNALGLLATETDARGMVMRYVYTQGTTDEASTGSNPLFQAGVTPVPGLLTQLIRDDGGLTLTTIYRDFDGMGNAGTIIQPDGKDTRTYTYDTMGRIVTMTDAEGKVSYAKYDGRGNRVRHVQDYTADGASGRNIVTLYKYDDDDQLLLEMTTDDGLTVQTRYTYDVNGQLARTADGRGSETVYLYDEADQLINMIDAAGHAITRTYGLDGQIASETDADGYTTRYIYDGLDRLVEQIVDEGGLNLTTEYVYDLNDNLLTMTDPVGTMICYTYDSHNRRTSETHDCGGLNLRTRYAYDLNGNRVYVTNERNTVTYYEYDALNRNTLIREDDAGLRLETRYQFDAAGNLAQITDERGTIAAATYDDLNRRVRVCVDVTTLNHCTQYTYDRLNYRTTELDPNGVLTRINMNAFGVPTALAEDANGLQATTTFAYDNALNLTQLTDANMHPTLYAYTARNELAVQTHADGTSIRYDYDRRGNLATMTNQEGDTLHQHYDAASRMIERSFSTGGSQQFTYDNLGRMLSASQTMHQHESQVTFAYNPVHHITRMTQSLDGNRWTTDYGYDYGQGVYTINYPAGNGVVWQTDVLNRLERLQTTQGTEVARYSYDELANTITTSYGNGVQNRVEFDALQRIERINATVFDLRYGYDGRNHRTFMQRTDTQISNTQTTDVYAYDGLYQLTDVWYGADATTPESITSSNRTQSFQLDALGNRLQADTDGTLQQYGPTDSGMLTNPMNRYEQVGTSILTYDQRGNLLTDGTNTYSYDILNQQIGVNDNIEYVYNALGQRIAKVVNGVTTHYVYDNRTRVIEERSTDDVLLAQYIYGGGIDEIVRMDRNQQRYSYHRDAQMSILAITDQTGAVVEQYAYDIYGQATILDANNQVLTASQIGNPYQYTGRRYDTESGNLYFRTRMYAPTLGRFLQMDTIGYEGGMNLYANYFVVNATDPNGTDLFDETELVGSGFYFGVGASADLKLKKDEKDCCKDGQMITNGDRTFIVEARGDVGFGIGGKVTIWGKGVELLLKAAHTDFRASVSFKNSVCDGPYDTASGCVSYTEDRGFALSGTARILGKKVLSLQATGEFEATWRACATIHGGELRVTTQFCRKIGFELSYNILNFKAPPIIEPPSEKCHPPKVLWSHQF